MTVQSGCPNADENLRPKRFWRIGNLVEFDIIEGAKFVDIDDLHIYDDTLRPKMTESPARPKCQNRLRKRAASSIG